MIFVVKKICNIYKGNNRYQSYFSTLEEEVSAENPVRLIDAFIDKLDLQKLGFAGVVVVHVSDSLVSRKDFCST
jgi:hypothetical protein